jgi:lipopolysaccharide/colanic/teichoic acid biosynthesis glycosyltransferase
MTINLYEPSVIISKELLFIGFDGNFNENIFNFPYDTHQYDYKIINNPFKVITWLEQKVETIRSYHPPFAIFIKLDYLLEDNFKLVHHITKNPDLKFVPIIALSDRNATNIDKHLLLSNGVDDCYAIPVEWGTLEARLDFLNEYKPRLLEYAAFNYSDDEKGSKMPFGKRIFDICFASAALIVLSPVFLLVAIAIAIEDGFPFFYHHKRAGTGYHVFNFYKFRSMYRNADKHLEDLKHLNQYEADGVFQKFKNDPRITRIGRFIRKYSIDELPQLINILKGDMSIVGNRPLPLYEAEMLTDDECSARFLGPAGLTGLWQVSRRGRADMSTQERVGLDIQYAHNYSVTTDLKIIFKTFTAFIQKENV